MLPIFESVIKSVLVTAAHCIILHIVVVFCCFYGTVNSTEFILFWCNVLNRHITTVAAAFS